MAKGKKKGNKRGGNAAADDASQEKPQRRLTKREQRALEREQAYMDQNNITIEEDKPAQAEASAPAPGNESKSKKKKRGKKNNTVVQEEAVQEKMEELTIDDEPKAAPAAAGFGALGDDSDESEEEEEEVAPKVAAAGFGALGDDSDESEEEEEEAAPAPKASGFAALNDDSEEEEEEEASPSPKASGFAALNDDSEEEEEEEASPAPKASGFAALDDSDSDDSSKKKKKKKKEKKEKKEKKKKKKGKSDSDDDGSATSKKKKKLSNKERRRLKAEEEKRESDIAASRITMTNFAVSQTAITLDDNWEYATDIHIPEFTISAFGKTLFENAELKIVAGGRYGLVGPNGMGKTTVLKQLANGELKIPPKIDVLYVEQEVRADDTPAVEMVLQADVRRTAILKREKEIMEIMDKGDYTEELQQELNELTLEMKASGMDDAEGRALSILHGLGFDAKMQQAPTKSFSGGWRMRVSIARALFMQPTLLLLDEPTNHLDLNAVIWLDDYLQKWKTTLLVVSHDQDFLDSVCTHIIHLDNKQLLYYKGNYEKFKAQFEQTRLKNIRMWEKQQKELRAAKKSGKSGAKAKKDQMKKKERESGGAKKNKKATQQGSSADNQTKLLARPKDYEVRFEFPEPSELFPPIIQVKDISFNYPDSPTLFRDLSFGIDMDSRITIVGPNGVGKSTLLKIITQELTPTTGEVNINRKIRIARYHQHFVDVLPMNETPVEFLTRTHTEVTEQETRQILGKFGLPGEAHKIKMTNLSGGQKSRVVFASLNFQHPHIIILDEPTNNLDIESIDALSDAINEFSGGVVLVSHDARLITSTDMRLWVCENETVEEMVGGFDAYKDEILTDIEKKAEAERKALELKLAQRAEARAKKLEEMKKRLEEKKKKAQEASA